MTRRSIAVALTLLAACAVTAHMAIAAVAYRITTDPADPIVGQPTTITVETFFPASPPAMLTVPQPLDEFPWTFVAEAPDGGRHVIDLVRTDEAGNAWSASFTFDEVGAWEIGLDRSHLGTPIDPSLGARVTVTVRADDGSPPIGILVAVVAGLLLAVVVVTARSRSARRTPPGGANDEEATAIRRLSGEMTGRHAAPSSRASLGGGDDPGGAGRRSVAPLGDGG